MTAEELELVDMTPSELLKLGRSHTGYSRLNEILGIALEQGTTAEEQGNALLADDYYAVYRDLDPNGAGY